jgi:excisionase family DNA binding protein
MKKDPTVYPSVKALANELGISIALAYRYLDRGVIPSIRLGNRYILPKAAIASWLASAGGKVPAEAA